MQEEGKQEKGKPQEGEQEEVEQQRTISASQDRLARSSAEAT